MKPEEKQLLERTSQEVVALTRKLDAFMREMKRNDFPSQKIIDKDLVLNGNFVFGDGTNIPLGGTTGTKIGTASSQKVGFLGATPVARQAGISSPSGGATIDSQARAAIDSIRAVLTSFGFTS